MEELRKLEKVQRMVKFMDSRGVSVSNSDHHCNRFLANFMLFLLEPCGELAIDDKCCLISELIPRVSNFSTPSLYFHPVFVIAFENRLEVLFTAFISVCGGCVSTHCHRTREQWYVQLAIPDLKLYFQGNKRRRKTGRYSEEEYCCKGVLKIFSWWGSGINCPPLLLFTIAHINIYVILFLVFILMFCCLFQILRIFLNFSLSLGFEPILAGSSLRSCSQMKENSLLQNCNKNIAMIGLDSMQKANSTLEDFVSIYSKSNLFDMLMVYCYDTHQYFFNLNTHVFLLSLLLVNHLRWWKLDLGSLSMQ